MWKDLKRIRTRWSKETDDWSCFIHYLASSLYSMILFVAGWLINNHFEPGNTTKNISEAAVYVVILHTVVITILISDFMIRQLNTKVKLLLGNKSAKLTKQK